MKIIDIRQGIPEWKQLRYTKIGCSDLADIMGVGFNSLYSLWREKVLELEREDNDDMRRGREQEPIALASFNKFMQADYKPIVATSDAHEWLMCSFDGWNGHMSVEIKCPRSKHHAEVPAYYMPQLQGSMAVSGADNCYFWSWYNGFGIPHVVQRDQKYIDDVLIKAKEFWDRVVNFDPPPMGKGDFIDRDQDPVWMIEAEKFSRAKRDYKEAEKRLEDIKQNLISLAAGNSCVGHGVRLAKVPYKGRISYDDIPEVKQIIKNINVEMYRSPAKEIWRVS